MEAFTDASGIAVETLMELFVGTVLVGIIGWAIWVIYHSWRLAQGNRLVMGEMASVWAQTLIIVAVITTLVLM